MAQTKKKAAKAAPKKKKKVSKNQKTVRAVCILAGIFTVLFLVILTFFSFYTTLFGEFGQSAAGFFKGIFGAGAYLFPFVLAFSTVWFFYQKRNDKNYLKIYCAAAFMVCIAIMQHALCTKAEPLPIKIDELYVNAAEGLTGGILGGLVCELLKTFMPYGLIFAVFLIAALLLLFVVFDKWFFMLYDKAKEIEIPERPKKEPAPKKKRAELKELPKEPVFEPVHKADNFENIVKIFNESIEEEEEPRQIDISDFTEPLPEIKNDFEDLPEELPDDERVRAEKDAVERILINGGREEKKPEEEKEDYKPPVEKTKILRRVKYKFPSVDLLEDNRFKNATSDTGRLKENALRLESILKSFGVEAAVKNIEKGPTITRYELQPSSGVRLSKIQSLQDDIKMNLAAKSIRIAPIPGKTLVGVEVPNEKTTPVFIKDIINSPEFKNNKSKLAFTVGMDITGKPVVGDLAKMPHVLIAGATGSGKSVCINTLITSILYRADPNEVKLIMIDPKVVELGVYNGIPHLLIPVVTDPKKAAGALNWAVMEMQNRYKLFAESQVRNIEGYNELMANSGHSDELMPKIVIIIDELADLMMAAPKDVEGYICRLAQLARAAGMHLVIATQRPSVNVITGLIKANVPSRIAFAVTSSVDSRTILDMGGAEKLLGKGDMLYHPSGAEKAIRVQGSLVTDKEVERVVNVVKANSEVEYDEDILEHLDNVPLNEIGGTPTREDNAGECDEKLTEAIELVMETGQASTSLLQRRLSLGYARAARVMDQMETRGIIGPSNGAKPREILITREEWNEMKLNS